MCVNWIENAAKIRKNQKTKTEKPNSKTGNNNYKKK